MSAKQRFLDELRTNLRKYPSGAVDDYIDYYDELISERVADGQKEITVLQQIGNPKEIAASFKKDNAIDRAVKKPTVSNGVKALIAVLGVLSLPFLVPAAVILIALLTAGVALFAAGLAVLVLGAVAAVLGVIDMASIVFTGGAPVYLLFLVTGVALVAVFLAFELMRGLFFIGGWATRSLIYRLSSRRNRKKQQGRDLSLEEQ
ncbi:MAG TPA: DUF1700 domain-containing protein [Candidatus Saccharimonadales bacterium]|jgi:uncharacterized membrane protein